jgi:predicted dehydrogenase
MHRILVIGVGSIGERHLRCMKNTGRAQVGLVETNATLAQDIARKYEVADAFTNLDEALKMPWTAAIICTPAQTHVPIAQKLADAGVNLLIEKPFSTSTDGIDRLISTVRWKKLVAYVAYVYHSHPGLLDMRNAIHSGKYGKPYHVITVSGQHFPFFRPAYRQIYFTDHAKGGGAIQDSLTHMMNAIEWLVGPMTRVTCDAAHKVLEGVTVEDTVNLTARHGEVMSSFAHNMWQMQNETFMTVLCEKATMRFEVVNHRWLLMDKINGPWIPHEFGPMERDDWFTRQSNLFVDSVEGKGSQPSPLCTLEEGYQTLRVNLAALKSAAAGGVPVDLPPAR